MSAAISEMEMQRTRQIQSRSSSHRGNQEHGDGFVVVELVNHGHTCDL
jgi:hypothetical protein